MLDLKTTTLSANSIFWGNKIGILGRVSCSEGLNMQVIVIVNLNHEQLTDLLSDYLPVPKN